MEKELKSYIKKIQDIEVEKLKSTELKLIAEDMLNQISFFQHERLVHLFVTISFAIFFLYGVTITIINFNFNMLLVTGLFFVLLIAYIKHYFILENGVQKLYKIYNSKISEVARYRNDRR